MNNCFQRILFWLDIFLLCFCLSLIQKPFGCLQVCMFENDFSFYFKYLFSWLPVSKYDCMYICLKVC